MKIVKISVLFLALSAVASASAMDGQYEAADNSYETKLCMTIATKSLSQVKRVITQANTSKLPSVDYKQVTQNIHCNGLHVADFAYQVGKINVANKLNKYRNTHVSIEDIAKKTIDKTEIVRNDS